MDSGADFKQAVGPVNVELNMPAWLLNMEGASMCAFCMVCESCMLPLLCAFMLIDAATASRYGSFACLGEVVRT